MSYKGKQKSIREVLLSALLKLFLVVNIIQKIWICFLIYTWENLTESPNLSIFLGSQLASDVGYQSCLAISWASSISVKLKDRAECGKSFNSCRLKNILQLLFTSLANQYLETEFSSTNSCQLFYCERKRGWVYYWSETAPTTHLLCYYLVNKGLKISE